MPTQEEASLNHTTDATPPPVEPSKPSPSQKDRQSPDSNLLTDSEFALLKKAALSSRESTKKLGSSAESVGSLGCRQVAKPMIQGYF